MHTNSFMYIYAHMYLHILTCTQILMYTYIHIGIHAYTHTCTPHMQTLMSTCAYVIRAFARVHILMCTFLHMVVILWLL